MSSSDDHRRDRDREETEDAAEHLKQGIGHLWRAARQAASGIKREVDRGGLGKSIDDAGRELVRAATNVVGRLGAEIEKLDADRRAGAYADAPHDGEPPAWPTTREEYERKYGAIDGDWPRTPDEYRKRYGEDPGGKPKGPTPEDPGFTIMRGDRDDDDH